MGTDMTSHHFCVPVAVLVFGLIPAVARADQPPSYAENVRPVLAKYDTRYGRPTKAASPEKGEAA
jgi:hypothetical protein